MSAWMMIALPSLDDRWPCINEPPDATPEVAIDACTRLLALPDAEPADRGLWYAKRGLERNRLQRVQAADRDFEEALRLANDDPRVWIARGIALGSDSSEPYYYRAFSYRRTGRLDMAERDYTHIVEHDRLFSGGWAGHCLIRAMIVRNLDGAESDCRIALVLFPNDVTGLTARSLHDIRRGRYDEAISDCDRVLRADPRKADCRYLRGVAERRTGKSKEARKDLAEADAIKPGIAEEYAGYGVK